MVLVSTIRRALWPKLCIFCTLSAKEFFKIHKFFGEWKYVSVVLYTYLLLRIIVNSFIRNEKVGCSIHLSGTNRAMSAIGSNMSQQGSVSYAVSQAQLSIVVASWVKYEPPKAQRCMPFHKQRKIRTRCLRRSTHHHSLINPASSNHLRDGTHIRREAVIAVFA